MATNISKARSGAYIRVRVQNYTDLQNNKLEIVFYGYETNFPLRGTFTYVLVCTRICVLVPTVLRLYEHLYCVLVRV